ncbi:MAG: hypothetical protein CL663_02015 [Bacteroidetes bacterium]|nr:hypothetical protein [Bacteroidota bacterium]|tara:strand:- start:114 stop:422 length:309 start_codon:yes stop_codon:yes gene_type:complete
MVVDLKANEIVTKAGDAQFYADDDQVKGKLILTNQRIYFKTLQTDKREFDMEIQPEDISELMYFKTRLFLQNGLTLVVKNGSELKFTVKNRDSWSTMINRWV